MSQKHVQQVVQMLRGDHASSENVDEVLQQVEVSKEALEKIPEDFDLADEDSYCSVTDIPKDLNNVGQAIYSDGAWWVSGTSGLWLVALKFTKE